MGSPTKKAFALKTVLAHGVFDLLHLGHIRHLEEARSFGDRLVVSVTPDKFVAKGAGRPHFTAAQRVEALRSLACVDDVFIAPGPTAAASIIKVKPKIYVKGPDYADNKNPHHRADVELLRSLGGECRLTTAEKWSSSLLLRSVRFPDATLVYLESAKARGFLDTILAAFEAADKFDIVFVGEAIIDEYCYVKPLAKPSKEFILATVLQNTERFEGGVIAAAKQGEWKNCSGITSDQAITKTRYVDADFSRKLFEVYSEQKITPRPVHIPRCDVCIALDFGHGMFTPALKAAVTQAPFLAVAAQSNAGNFGFNPVTRWPHVDYVCVDEPEARLAVDDQDGPLIGVHDALARRATRLVVTRGRYGCICPQPVPALVEHGFDTMGAGDAFIAVSAPLLAAGLPVELAAFAGNVAGGLKTAILGHRSHVTRDDIVRNLEWLLK